VLWQPLLLVVPLLAGAIGALFADAALGASRARFSAQNGSWRLRVLTGFMYLLQPLARLRGRIRHGLTPWRRRGSRSIAVPAARSYSFWSEQWQSTEDRVRAIIAALRADGSVIRSGGAWDRWDLQVRGGLLGVARLRIGVEEHGSGRQLVRLRAWPHVPRLAMLLGVLAGMLTVAGVLSDADTVAAGLGLVAAALVLRAVYECGAACGTVHHALHRPLRSSALRPAGTEPQPATVELVLGVELE
jgi:hypothetical protein